MSARHCGWILPLLLACLAWTQPTRAKPLPLTQGIHPMVDRQLVESLDGRRQVLHPPVRQNVVLVMDRRWEGEMSAYGTVLRDPDGKVRLYYRGGGDIDPPEVTCVAFSDDGVTFERPSLGQYEIRGTRENNVVFTADRPSYGESHNFAPFVDANPDALAETKWKAFALKVDEDDQGERQRMLTVLGSPDGIEWTHLAERPVIRSGGFDSANLGFFDAANEQYVCYFRVGRDGMRSFARAHLKDFISWTIDEPLTFEPEQDEQWYTNGVTPYPGVAGLYLALPMRFVPQRKTVGDPPRETDGLSDAVIMSSRDGTTWDRTFREAFIRPGPDSDNWGNAHGNQTPLAGIVETGEGEWSVYWFEGGTTGAPRIRRGTVRAHGLASIHGGADGGSFTTPLLTVPEGEGEGTLHLNFATSAIGSIRVEVLDEAGEPLEGYMADEADEIYGDEPARQVKWADTTALPTGEAFKLRFALRDADLFAIEVR